LVDDMKSKSFIGSSRSNSLVCIHTPGILTSSLLSIARIHDTSMSRPRASIGHKSDKHVRGSGGRMALRPEAWKAATLDVPRALRTKAVCSDWRASGLEVRKVDAANEETGREAICFVGAAAKACLSIVERAIEAMSEGNG
jgi:hypothetical protein